MNIWADANGWPVPPTVLVGCLVVEILYFRGWSLITTRARAKQAARAKVKARAMTSPILAASVGEAYQWDSWFWRGIFFVGAIIAFLVASSAPIDILSSRLLWVHMIQHLLLLVVVAPLLVAAAPLLPLWLGLPRWGRRIIKGSVKLKARRTTYRIGEWFLGQPVIACVLFIAGIWIWHWPPLYDLALTDHAIHDWGEHTTFLVVSMIFWAQIIPAPPTKMRLGYLGRLGCIGVAIIQNIALAVVIAFAQTPIYAPYAHLITAPGGLTALQDQQLGAGIMWTFGDLPFGIAFSVLVHRWLVSQSDDASSAQPSLHSEEKVHAIHS